MNKYKRIAQLISIKLLNTISNSELIELDKWLKEKPENKYIYTRIVNRIDRESVNLYDNVDKKRGLHSLYSKYDMKFIKEKKNNKIYSKVAILSSMAAVIAVIFISLDLSYKPKDINISKKTIAPMESTAILIMDDGSVKKLKNRNSKISNIDGVTVINKDKTVSYNTREENKLSKTEIIKYHTLKTGTGGMYSIILNDGTEVLLNSKSSLRYPVHFNKNKRTVLLDGEAYFNVTKDKKRPFIVSTKQGVDIKVLGTMFNLSAYVDDTKVEAVLEKGSIEMRGNKDSVVIYPGNMATLSISGSEIEVTKVDVNEHISWRSNSYIFNDEPLWIILKKLSRWYNFEVKYMDKYVKNATFTGSVKKYDNINKFLEAIEMTESVEYEIINDTINIRSTN